MELPEGIKAAIAELKKRHEHSVVVKFLRGSYYAYEAYSKWDPLLKKRRTYSLYLGKIELDGSLVPPRRKSAAAMHVRSVEGYVKAKDGEERKNTKAKKAEEDISILTALSTNARASYEEIGRKAGISAQSARRRIEELENKYAITYTIDTHAALNFGFYRFMITVRFNGRKPEAEEIKRELEKEPRIQLAMSTKGEFDLLIYALFENTVKLDDWLYRLRKSETFAQFDAEWSASYFLISNGLVPLREEFFEIVKERVWHRTRETPRRKEGEIFYREYAVLKALNKNGIEKFNDIDKKYGLRKGSADYTFQELVKRRVIRRVTISMNNLPIKYLAIIWVYIQNMKEFLKSGKEYFLYTMQDKGMLTNKVIISGDIGSPYSIIGIHPIYDDGGLEKEEERIYGLLKGVKIRSTIISGIMLGSLCLNKLETKEMPIYEFLKKEHGLSEEEILQRLNRVNERPKSG